VGLTLDLRLSRLDFTTWRDDPFQTMQGSEQSGEAEQPRNPPIEAELSYDQPSGATLKGTVGVNARTDPQVGRGKRTSQCLSSLQRSLAKLRC